MQLLITGSSGFLAQNLILLINKQYPEYEVIGIDKVKQESSLYKHKQIDFTPNTNWTGFFKKIKPEVIIHTIANFSKEDPLIFNTNTVAFYYFINAINSMNINPLIVVIGSAAEYGIVKPEINPIKESTPLVPINMYGLSKKWQEEISLYYFNNYGLKTICTRPSNLIGKGISQNLLPGYLTEQFNSYKQEIPVDITSLNSKRDYIDVRDVSSAIMLLLNCKKAIGEVFNISSAKCVSNKKLIEVYESLSNKKAILTTSKLNEAPFEISLSNEKLKKFVSWKQRYSLLESVQWTLSEK